MTIANRVEDGVPWGIGPRAQFDYGSLPALLSRVAQQAPQKLALVDGYTAVTYDQLLAMVHRLGNYLIYSGCRQGNRIATIIPRSLNAIVAQCAVMTIGAVYVPLDPATPRTLLGELLDSARIDHAVGVIEKLSELQPASGRTLHRTLIDEPSTMDRIAQASSEAPAIEFDASDGAYILHTSGSAGPPKGVLVSHGAAANAIAARRYHYPQHPITGLLMLSPLTFDGSIADIWWTFADAGAVVLAPTDPTEAMTAVRRTVEHGRQEISHVRITPTLYLQVLQCIRYADNALRQVLLGGEVCPESVVRTHYDLMPEVELVAIYGPTETTLWCATAVLKPDKPVSVGAPLVNVEILLLDPDSGQPAPNGVSGEVCIAGTQVAIGYISDPALTAKKFVPHPSRPRDVMYRSGDLGRWRSNGTLEILGRIANQIETRGSRVDLARVREQLRRCQGVADLAVAIRRVPGGRGGHGHDEILTAYVVPALDKQLVDDAHKRRWERIFNDLAAEPRVDRTFDTTGWISSYTGAAIAIEDMTEWVDATAQLMRETDPSTVLDLGCGTGMPLFRVAPHCSLYVGADSSERTIVNLSAAVQEAGLNQVQLHVGAVTDVEAFAGQGFDLIVCNSVTQYLPGEDYLARILNGALNAVSDGGRIIFGDVRDLSLQTEFHSAVVRAQADAHTSHDEVVAHFERRISGDRELVIDPGWFTQELAGRTDTLLEIRPRRGRRRNEMTAFRFDVVVHFGSTVEPVEIGTWLDWSADGMSLDSLRTLLASRPDRIGLSGVPNARTQDAIAAAAELFDDTPDCYGSARSTSKEPSRLGVEPEELFLLAAEAGYRCHLSRLSARPGGAFDVALLRRDAETTRTPRRQIPLFANGGIGTMPANRPLASEPRQHQVLITARTSVVPALRRYAAEHLAAHERPEAYVVVPALPVTATGEVDVAALPAPAATRP